MSKNYRGIFLIAILFIVLLLFVFSGTIYRNFIKPNKQLWPVFVRQYIDKRDSRRLPDPIVFKPEKTIKIVEGWNLYDFHTYINSLPNWSGDELLKITGQPKKDYRLEPEDTWPVDFSDRFSFLESKPKYYGLEGFLFPDTYRVFEDATIDDLVIKMLENFDSKLSPEMRKEIERQGRTIYDVIILASLVEKEALINYSDPENIDARTVAGIFLNRLKIGQALQADATLTYVFNNNKPAHSGEELKVDSPFNTYRYRGLPPTPIANPGIKAIEAAINPLSTNYYYFLTTLDGVNIYYARTYEEHLQNKYKYLK